MWRHYDLIKYDSLKFILREAKAGKTQILPILMFSHRLNTTTLNFKFIKELNTQDNRGFLCYAFKFSLRGNLLTYSHINITLMLINALSNFNNSA